MTASIEPVKAKLNRAKSHAAEFDACEADFLKRDPYAINIHLDPESPYTVHFTWQVKEDTPIELAVILGDMLSNLRATLDYLVWQLVLANNQPPTDEGAFPCVRKSENWASAVGQRLKGVDPTWIGEIEKLQPYHRKPDPKRHLFAVLDWLNNANKHRTLPPRTVKLPSWQFDLDLSGMAAGAEMNIENFLGEPFEHDKDFLRLTFDPPSPELGVKLQQNPSVFIQFQDGLDHSDGWTYTQADLIDWVERAVAIFEPAFLS